MVNMLAQASDWLQGKRREILAHDVTYQRGDVQIIIPATIGKTVFQTTDAQGMQVEVESRDYQFTHADLIVDNARIFPGKDDRIIETIDGITTEYRISVPAGGTPWSWADLMHRTIVAHTKKVKVDS